LIVFIDPQSQEHRCRECVTVAGIDLIAGKLFGNEPVVGFVVIERTDHVIAILLRFRTRMVGSVTVGIGVSNQVQPVTCLVLTICRFIQQAIDELLIAFIACNEGLCGIPGRQASQREMHTSSERPAFGFA
jgi:hypothetical protein